MWNEVRREWLSGGRGSGKRKSLLAVFLLGLLLFLFFLSFAAFAGPPAHDTLTQVHILFRHGLRTPTSRYPTDPYNESTWADGWGQLVNKGKMEMFTLGKSLRSRYSGFLSEEYNVKDFLMKSSYADRCQMSGQALLAGLFPPTGRQVWNPDLPWQPIPVHSIPRDRDIWIAAKVKCEGFDKEKAKVDKELNDHLAANKKELLEYLSEKTGQPVRTAADIETLYHILASEVNNGKELPEWTHSVFPGEITQVAYQFLTSFSANEKLKFFQSGPLIKEWVDHMEFPSKKMFMYSGHDLTLLNLLRSLNASHTPLPQYGAALVMELHGAGEDSVVEVFYYESGTSQTPQHLTFPHCPQPCLFSKWKSLLRPLVSGDWEMACKVTS